MNTLNYRPNLQYDPIEIGDFCVVEVYTDSINPDNGIGYFIQPLSGLENPKATIEERVRQSAVAGYENLVILAGRNTESFSHKRIYAVWYNGSEVPTYPSLPEIVDPGPAHQDSGDVYQECVVDNPGAPTYCSLTLTLSAIDQIVDFYVNEDYFKIDLTQEHESETMILVVDKHGVKYNGTPISSFEFADVPKLTYGKNIIKVNRGMITHIDVSYQYTI